MQAGIEVKVEFFIPYDPKDLGSMEDATAKVRKLTDAKMLAELAGGVVVESVKHNSVNRRKA